MTALGVDRLLTSLSPRFASLELEQLASALDFALEQVCLAINTDAARFESAPTRS